MSSTHLRACVCFVLLVLSGLVVPLISRPLIAQRIRTEHVLTRRILAEPLAGKNGKSLELVEVSLGPASHGGTPTESNGCQTAIYVAEGTLQLEALGRSEGSVTHEPGSAFNEPPHLARATYRNASTIREARYLVISVCDHDSARP